MLQQALALSPGEPLVLVDLTELAEELGRYDDLAELVQSWQAVEGDPGRAMVLSIRRADALLRGGQRDQARALLASLEASAPGFIVLTSAAERDALGRERSARPRADVPRRGARRAARHAGSDRASRRRPIRTPPRRSTSRPPSCSRTRSAAPRRSRRRAARSARRSRPCPSYPAALEALTELDDTTGNVAEALARLRRPPATAAEGDARRAVARARDPARAQPRRSRGGARARAPSSSQLAPSDLGAALAARGDARRSSAATTSAPSCSSRSRPSRPMRRAAAPRCSPRRGCASAPVPSRRRPSCTARCSRCGPRTRSRASR